MAINCNVCEGTGFQNFEQVPVEIQERGTEAIVKWIHSTIGDTDARVCHCCGDGVDWYGEPGRHYTSQDPIGKHGPYAYNGGLAECH